MNDGNDTLLYLKENNYDAMTMSIDEIYEVLLALQRKHKRIEELNK